MEKFGKGVAAGELQGVWENFPHQLEHLRNTVKCTKIGLKRKRGQDPEAIYAKSVTTSRHNFEGKPHLDEGTASYGFVIWYRIGEWAALCCAVWIDRL